jgi:hypothetical protein
MVNRGWPAVRRNRASRNARPSRLGSVSRRASTNPRPSASSTRARSIQTSPALEFGQDLGQGAALVLGEALFGAGGHLFRPVGAGEEDAAARQAAAEVEQEPDRGGVGPLQVIHDQEQRMVLRQTAEDVGHLLQEVLGCQALQGMI